MAWLNERRQKKKVYLFNYEINYTSIYKMNVFIFFTVAEDPYYCGLSARVPKFDRTTIKKSSNNNRNQMNVPKRMSVAYLQHPALAYMSGGYHPQYASQQQLMVPQYRQNFNHHQQVMWHARSMESGLGKIRRIYSSTLWMRMLLDISLQNRLIFQIDKL